MLSAKAAIFFFISGSAVGLSTITIQEVDLSLAERYGLLGIHAILVISILKIGWEQVKTMRAIAVTIQKLSSKVDSSFDKMNREREVDVDQLTSSIKQSNTEIVSILRGKK